MGRDIESLDDATFSWLRCLTRRENRDRQMFSRVSSTNQRQQRVVNNNSLATTTATTSAATTSAAATTATTTATNVKPLTSDDYSWPLTLAACMLVRCPVCLQNRAGSAILYTSPCQHAICRECFLKMRTYAPSIRCPQCQQLIVEVFMFYRPSNSVGRMAHFSAIPRYIDSCV